MFVHKLKKNKLIQNENKLSLEKVNIRSQIPAVTHIDNSARIQTISNESNKHLYNLLSKFEKKTNCPVLVNTSFNVRGEPMVNTPKEAFECFMGTNLDILVIENFYLKKKDQLSTLLTDYKNKFKPD